MTNKGNTIKTTRCRVCYRHGAKLTNWETPVGIDPGLRQFQCQEPLCGAFIYKRIKEVGLDQKSLV